jgi:uncharacterized protein (DUF1330 family)
MLNLLRFADDGRPSYERYAKEIRRFLEEVGAEIVYLGDCSTLVVGTDAHHWDAVLLVRYPSRQAFSDMVRNPEYQQITSLRTAALSDAILQATTAW